MENEKLVIKEAKFSDLNTIRGLLQDLSSIFEKTEGIDINFAIKNFSSCLRNPNSYIFVAFHDGNPIGLVNFSVRNTLMHKGLSAIIDELIVKDEFHNQGIGKELICNVVAKCKDLNCCEIEVSAECDDTPAIDFYKNCGFKQIGIYMERAI